MSSYGIGVSEGISERPVVAKLAVEDFAAGSSIIYIVDGKSKKEEFEEFVEYDPGEGSPWGANVIVDSMFLSISWKLLRWCL